MAECYKTIEYPDRKAIAALYAAGAKAGQIAKEIGVAPRTIYAELKRGREGDKLDKNFRPSYDADLGPEARPGKPSPTRPEERRAGRMTPRARQRRTRRRIHNAGQSSFPGGLPGASGKRRSRRTGPGPPSPWRDPNVRLPSDLAGLLAVAGAFDTTGGRRERRR